jgi:SAM-dependent methyltransferase
VVTESINIDDHNVVLATSTRVVDDLNARFYGRFQYPWVPMTFDCLSDPYFETVMLNQSIGDWNQTIVPRRPKIWVAGCGANQAVITALRFPHATVVGSDLSTSSLATASESASQLKVTNIELRHESINHVPYRAEFDYIICTGVIHHNADPSEPLEKLMRALKPSGILELMVYNRYHRLTTTAFQKALRTFNDSPAQPDFESELQLTKKIISSFKMDNSMGDYLKEISQSVEPQLADSLLQPVEHSYTIESLETLLDACGLEYLAPCVTQFDKIVDTFNWNLEFDDSELQQQYESLPDSRRWQIANQLMLEKSPLLWFFLQRKDSGRVRKGEQQICDDFLDQRFVKSSSQKRTFLRNARGEYNSSARLMPYPGRHTDNLCQRIVAEVDASPSKTLREVFQHLEIGDGFTPVNKLRLMLTTNAFPFLVTAR